MPAFRGRNVRPEQIHQTITRDGARASLEMQVQEDSEVFLGAEPNGRAGPRRPPANELGRSENVELKLSSHNVLRLG